MKTTSILLIFTFLTMQIGAQNTLAYSDGIIESIATELEISSKKINSQPTFPGGAKGLSKYLTNNIKYPRNPRNLSCKGKVIVSFKIEKDGAITEVKVIKGTNKILNKEAKRVVSNMPNWKPAVENGIAVNTKLNIPIVFFRN